MQQPIKCLAVDDEPLALDIITEYIEQTPVLQLVTTTCNPYEVVQLVNDHQVDLLFLDVQMPGMTGIDVIKLLNGRCEVILTTAFPQYALDGFELEVIDYLLKPISMDRFRKAVQKVVDKFQRKDALPSQASISGTQNPDSQTDRPDHIFVKTDYKNQRIDFDRILYIEGLKDYVSIYTDEGRVVTLQVMKKMEEFLPSDQFMRVHRSYIVSLKKIKSVDRNRIYISDQIIPIGDTYKEAFFKLFELRKV
jgi:two-component system LytT family response regulator